MHKVWSIVCRVQS